MKQALFATFVAVGFSIAFNIDAAGTATVTTLRTPDDGIQPQAAVDAEGVVHLIFFKGDPKGGDIFYAREEPGQSNFSTAMRVNTQPHTATAIGTIRGAQLAVGKDGRVHVAWDGMGDGVSAAAQAQRKTTEDKAPLFYTRLNDAGTAFEPERNVITYAYGLDGGSSVAADADGNVYVTWHAALPGNTDGEGGRAVFIARSTDEGRDFQRETPAIAKRTGACACCGMRAFADAHGDVFALYRGAYQMTNRDETLLISHDKGASFEVAFSEPWSIGMCPMSSATLSESGGQILAAAETHGHVFFVRVDPKTGKVSAPVSPETKGKYPVAVANGRGEILLAWAEGTGWNKGGVVAWQIYDRDGRPSGEKSHVNGLAAWSLPTAFVDQAGNFTIVY